MKADRVRLALAIFGFCSTVAAESALKDPVLDRLQDAASATATFLRLLNSLAPSEAAKLNGLGISVEPHDSDHARCNVPHRLAGSEMSAPRNVTIYMCRENMAASSRVVTAALLTWATSTSEEESKNILQLFVVAAPEIVRRFSLLKGKNSVSLPCSPGALAYMAIRNESSCADSRAVEVAAFMWPRITSMPLSPVKVPAEMLQRGYWTQVDEWHEIVSILLTSLVFFHEIGHVVNGDLAPESIYTKSQEAIADHFAIAVTGRLPQAAALTGAVSAHLVFLTYAVSWYWADPGDNIGVELPRIEAGADAFLCNALRQFEVLPGMEASAARVRENIHQRKIRC
ncbi:MAG: hypothetical protein Q8K71_17450 [Polaromonas sp.]|nr:hypothetical protein [Polaromonas sp.]MDP3752124.1 hypothetical protein [Polaromonas sp.]